MAEIPIDSRQVLRELAAAAAERAVRSAPIPKFRSGTCASILATATGEVAVFLDGESEMKFGQVVGGFYPRIGDRLWCLEQPPHGLVVTGRIGLRGNNPGGEDFQGFGGASPTDSLTAAAFTPWPLVMSTTVAVPVVAVRMIAEAIITGLRQSAASGDFNLRMVTAAGTAPTHAVTSATGGARYGVTIAEEFDVSAYAGGIISARMDGMRFAGAGSLDYDSRSRGRWLFRFYES